MAKIEVTLSEIRGAATKIKKASEEFLSCAGKVLSTAETLSHSWEGDSQVAFMEEQRLANEWYRQMMALVNTYVSNLQEAAQLYEGADAESASAIRAC
jgi:WXG100 family type VII secretion target